MAEMAAVRDRATEPQRTATVSPSAVGPGSANPPGGVAAEEGEGRGSIAARGVAGATGVALGVGETTAGFGVTQ